LPVLLDDSAVLLDNGNLVSAGKALTNGQERLQVTR
jgi:hypothetical protein